MKPWQKVVGFGACAAWIGLVFWLMVTFGTANWP